MPTIALTLPKPHPKQHEIIHDDSRFLVVVCGRRFGKTVAGMERIVMATLKGLNSWWIAPSHNDAVDVWRQIKKLLEPVTSNVSESLKEIECVTGGRVTIKSAGTGDNLRGAGLDFVVFDECAFIDGQIWHEVVRPMLMTTKGKALFLSTPNGRNWFFDLYTNALRIGDNWRVKQYTSYDNPRIDRAELEELADNMPDKSYHQEILAEFIDQSGAVFRNVRACVYGQASRAYEAGKAYVIGVDLAKTVDYTVLTVLCVEDKKIVEIQRFNTVEYVTQLARLESLANTYHAQAVVIETNNTGTAFIELARRALNTKIIRFDTTNASKQKLIDSLVVAFEKQEISIPDDMALIGELLAYEAKTLPSDNIRYSAPDNQHDDMVMSLGFAWFGLKRTIRNFETINF